ncbi:MAG: glycyl-radical enzyme activating protein family [Herbinix sp.]|jgi:pyruvate formate lyase activating enzyme|nr:glycyl-radical enzyme activating protein family [Herbinix sp.]
MTTGKIFNIQRFSVQDGPGVRTTVFFKGCNLKCKWCHNPESISFKNQIELYKERCIGCGKCYVICPQGAHSMEEHAGHRIDRDKCIGCFQCAENCFAEALVGVGSSVSVEKLMEAIVTDELYYKNSGGGVTFSGGECMLQADFLKELLIACKQRKLHTAIDTAGAVPWTQFEKVLDWTDLYLYDLKAVDSKVHKQLTGVDNTLIIENLIKLTRLGKEIVIRIPYIIGLNDMELEGMSNLLQGLTVARVEVLGYHKLGDSKYHALEMENQTMDLAIPSEERIIAAVEYLKKKGINAIKK